MTDTVIEMDDISGVSLGDVYGNGDTRSVSFPISADIFKAQGGGLNFVHGGCSPQEMIIPLIDVKTEKSKVETTFAEISMTTNTSKITNLSVNLEFSKGSLFLMWSSLRLITFTLKLRTAKEYRMRISIMLTVQRVIL